MTHGPTRATHMPIPAPGPACAAVAPLLPLLGQAELGLLAGDEAARARAHVAECPHCLAVLAGYTRLDGALRRLTGSVVEPPTRLAGEIMESIEERDQPHAHATLDATEPAARRPARMRRVLVPTGAVAAVLLLSLLAAGLFAGRGWLLGHTPLGGLPGVGSHTTGPTFADQYYLSAIVPAGANGTWLLGGYTPALCFEHEFQRVQTAPMATPPATPDPACASQPLVLKWDGQGWQHEPISVGVPIDGIWHVSVLPSGEAFALAGTTMLHLKNGTWSVDPAYTFPSTWRGADQTGSTLMIQALTMLSPAEGWAVGGMSSSAGNPAFIAHYTAGKWTVQPAPDGPQVAILHSISMASPTEGWAVGTDATETLTEHYHSGKWSVIYPTATVGPNDQQDMPGSLNAVQMLPSGDAWAVGSVNPSSGPGLILHWANGQWNQVEPGIPLNILHSIDMISPTEGWVVGDGAEILHLHDGKWTKEGATVHGFETDQVAMVSASEGWAIGTTLSSSNFEGPQVGVIHYQHGAWTMIPLSTIMAQAAKG